MAVTWTDSEPGYFALRRELGRLWHRAGRRPFRVLLAALAVAGVAVLFAYRAPRRYTGQISLRVTEVVEFSLPRSAWTDRELRSYVTDVAFTSAVLRDVYEHELRGLDKGDPGPGIARLRENLQVSVVRNRIMAQPRDGEKSGPRSAYVVLRFPAMTEAKSLSVLRALTKPIIETSTRRRRDEAAQESQQAALALAEARMELSALTSQALTTAGKPLAGSGDVSPVRLIALESAINNARLRVAHFQNEKDEIDRRQRAEKARPGINFDIVDESVERPLPLAPLLGGVGILAFLFALPLAILMVGAFDPFIESVEDIRRLGIPILGRLRPVRRA